MDHMIATFQIQDRARLCKTDGHVDGLAGRRGYAKEDPALSASHWGAKELLLPHDTGGGGGGGGIRLIAGFQPLMVISPNASWIRWCMQV